MKRTGLLSLVFVAAMSVGCHRGTTANETANGTPGAAGTSGNGVSSGDVNFVRDVTDLNNTEIDLSRLAAERSTNGEVKKFAQMTITDHTAAGDKLSSIASQNSVDNAPKDKDIKKTDDERAKLEKEQGVDFDRAYIDEMIESHDKLLSKLGSRVDKQGSGDNAAVVPEKSDNAVTSNINQWAADTYPTAKAHLDQAKSLKDTLKK
jgi:putative membrane protein